MVIANNHELSFEHLCQFALWKFHKCENKYHTLLLLVLGATLLINIRDKVPITLCHGKKNIQSVVNYSDRG